MPNVLAKQKIKNNKSLSELFDDSFKSQVYHMTVTKIHNISVHLNIIEGANQIVLKISGTTLKNQKSSQAIWLSLRNTEKKRSWYHKRQKCGCQVLK